jgi:NTP pyrophosphatase (non-canonical NTP hydrolase)
MEESRLTPFDAETILMIKSVTGHEPEITEKAEFFEMKMYVDDKDEYIVKAAIDAVAGRYGMRVRAVEHIREQIFLRGATFLVEYEKGAENMPNEIRADLKEPNDNAGYLYCRRLLEVRAVPVSRDNIERLIDFTGGGTMEIPRKPGEIGLYSFITENGVIMSVPERWVVVRFPDGRFGKMDYKTFVEEFEEKEENNPVLSFSEKRLFAKMNNLFGKNIQGRFSKLTEEYHELFVAADDMLVNGIMPDDMTEIIDELADVNAVLFYIAALFGYSQKELLEMTYKKIAGREKNQEFMRKHPHKEPESPVCNYTKPEIIGEYQHFYDRFYKTL